MTNTSRTVEHVLVVPTLLFHEIGYFQGFTDRTEPYLSTLLDPGYTSYRPRDAVEEDPSFKQLIPYCIFRCRGEVFHYKRGKTQGEGRLHSLRSIGIGGHISAEDEASNHVAESAGNPGIDGESSVYLTGMWREISEEIELDTPFEQRCVGLINDDETAVGRVHLGIVHVFDLESPKVRPREESIIETGFAPPEQLAADRDRFETWSRICLDYLCRG